MGRRLGGGGLLALFFLGTTTLYTFPFVPRPARTILTGLGDYLGEASLVALNARYLSHDPTRLFDSMFFYPHSNTIAYGQSLFFPGLLAVPVFLLGGQPLLATNLLLILALVLSGVFMSALAFSLTGRVVPSLLAGVVFAYFPNRMDHLGQFTVQTGALLPPIVWAFHRFLMERRWRHLAVVVFGIWAQVLSSMYLAYALGFLLLGLFLACSILRPGLLGWPLLGRATIGLGMLGAALFPFLRPYLDLHREAGLARDIGQAEWFGMDLLSILDPGVLNTLYGGRQLSLGRSEGGLFPGFAVLGLVGLAAWALRWQPAPRPLPVQARVAARGLLAVLALCLVAIVTVSWSGVVTVEIGHLRLLKIPDITLPVNLLPVLALGWVALEGRRRLEGPLTRREWVVSLVFLTVLMYLLTLAPTIRVARQPWGTAPFNWIFRYAPGGSAFRAPGRWSLVFVVPLALLAAFGAAAVADALRGRWARLGPGLLLVAVMTESLDLPIPLDQLRDPPLVYRWLAEQPGDFAILELPTYKGPADAFYQYWQSIHGKRLVNGAVGFVPATIDELVEAWNSRDLDTLMARIRPIYPLRHVVVHRAILGAADRARWEGLPGSPPPGLRFLRTIETDDVYELVPAPQSGSEVLRYFSVDYVRRHPVAEVALRFGGDPEIHAWVATFLNGRPVARVEREGRETIRLAPPYRVAGRNELRFRSRYDLRWDAVGDKGSYRIGTTEVLARADIEVLSAGKEHGDRSSIRVNGLEVSPDRRGYNLVVLDPGTGQVTAAEVFDTFRSAEESHRMARFIDGLAPGTVVVASVKDDGGGQLTEEGVRALRSLGGQADLQRTLFLSHLLVGAKGAQPGQALESAGLGALTAIVGARRRQGLTLESFALR